MYGFDGYATNTYAARRFLGGLPGPVIQTGAITLRFLSRAIVQPLSVFQNDFGYQIPFVLQDGNGNAVNLNGAGLALKIQSAQDPTDTLINLGGTMNVDSAAGGTCHYTVANGDFSSPGTFLAQLSVTYGNETISWGGFQIVVLPMLPKTIN
jgi:BppU N-terminal domain